MTTLSFEEAKLYFNHKLPEVIKERAMLHRVREDFVAHFSPAKISNMDIKEYAMGWGKDSVKNNFCQGIEKKLDGLGRIYGSTSRKFGMYYRKDEHDFYIAKKFGTEPIKAFENVRRSLIELLDAGGKEDLERLAGNPLSSMFKGKILSTYYPDTYLNVFSDDHLTYFVTQFGLDLQSPALTQTNEYAKKSALVNFKNQDVAMQHWSIDVFSHFLYHYFPGRPLKNWKDHNSEYSGSERSFPSDPNYSFVNLDIVESDTRERSQINRTWDDNTDYEKDAKWLKKIGNRGEEIVFSAEKFRLKKAGRQNLAAKVKRIEVDSVGFDILSYDENGAERFIEVKTTTSKPGYFNFFLSANELAKAETLDNYKIYVVFDIFSANPKIWIAGNPFKPLNGAVTMKPQLYRIAINVV
ncbi:DUF3883 domain-containing protein [Chitinophaga ginsengisoli]|uniref:Uncharacterized protein DUF3883 n=1 Tax=Chitinophaga ginsengisoli TaxID=363837 RepID=A0A2P8FXL4_9BACT|nr:DUF3883 domain-containing protein [Chitinophaga ginsengisoli]PSL26457.1 uncharacterized protein DUF3883 [Chitinophaga ginsengisoli]